jgi:apolipoprotein N-acyltransferase
VGLVDQAVQPLDRWNPNQYASILRTLRSLTSDAEAEAAELTIWPEGAYPYELDHRERTAPLGRHALLGNGVHGPLLIGLVTSDQPAVLPNGEVEVNGYNSAVVVMPDGSLSKPYDKLQLLWFGEMVPLGNELPWLRRLFARGGGLLPGQGPQALDASWSDGGKPVAHMAVLNCYEDTLTDVARRQVRALAPNLLVNITNDAWFYGTAEPELHARLAALRAVEFRLDLVRAVNLGVTSWVDATGTVRARYDQQAPAAIVVTPTLRSSSLTVYARLGDGPAYVLLVALTVAFSARERSRRQRPSPSSAGALRQPPT